MISRNNMLNISGKCWKQANIGPWPVDIKNSRFFFTLCSNITFENWTDGVVEFSVFFLCLVLIINSVALQKDNSECMYP